MKTNLRVVLLTLLVFALSLFAEARVNCKINNVASLYGFNNSYEGTVIFYTGKELNKKTWWKVWDEDYPEKRIYAVFKIHGEKIVVETDMVYSSYYSKKFDRKYFDNIMSTKTEGFDQKNKKWYITWDFINPFGEKNRKSVF